MSCATCHDRKVVRRNLARAMPWRLANAAVEPSRMEQVDVPCPACGPFAVAVETTRTVFQIEIGGVPLLGGLDYAEAVLATEALNDAVVARERHLRTKIDLAATVVANAIQAVRERQLSIDPVRLLIELSDILGGHCGDFVSGDVACAMAFDAGIQLGRLELLHEGTWGILCERLMENDGKFDRFALALIAELGIGDVRTESEAVLELREALRMGINHMAADGGSSTAAFKAMRTAFDHSSSPKRRTWNVKCPECASNNVSNLAQEGFALCLRHLLEAGEREGRRQADEQIEAINAGLAALPAGRR